MTETVSDWVLVPRERTEAMHCAAQSTTTAIITRAHSEDIWIAMLAAAPSPPQNTDGEAVAGLIGRLRASADRLDEHFQFDGDVKLIEADEMREAASALSAMKAERDEQHDIVARIWVQLGSPTYEQLAGCSIHDLIEELQDSAARGAAAEAENAALKSDLTRYIDIATKEATEAESLRAKRDALAKALEPFAKAAEEIDDNNKDRWELWEHPAAMSILVGDLRRARSTLHGDAK